MNSFSLKKFKRLYHKHTEHIESFDFRKSPKEARENLTDEDFKTLCSVICIRDTDRRSIIVNEAVEGWRELVNLLIPLDLLPVVVLNDIYSYYNKRCKGVTVNNMITFNEDESFRRTILCLMPEVMWCKGNDTVKSRIFE